MKMESLQWEESREAREQAALAFHSRLSQLFNENRFAFELERKRLIDGVINQAHSEEEKQRLRALQESIDKKMKNAGSEHNRFVLMQKIFWDQVDSFRKQLSGISF